MKEINPKAQAVYFNKAKRIHVVVDWNVVLNDRSTILGIPVLKSGSTNRWMQVGNQQESYKVLDLEPISDHELVTR